MTKRQTLNERLACCASGGGIVPNRKLVADAQSRIAELEAEVARLKATNTVDGWDAARWKHEYDVQRYLAQSAWNDAIDAAKEAAYQWAQINAEGGNTYTDLLHVFRSLRR